MPEPNTSGQYWGEVEVGWGAHQNMCMKEVGAGCLRGFEQFCGWGMLACKFDHGSYKSGIEPDFYLREYQFLIGHEYMVGRVGKGYVVCVAPEQLPVRRNALPMAFESNSFQTNHLDSIILYSCLPHVSLTSLTKIPLYGQITGLL